MNYFIFPRTPSKITKKISIVHIDLQKFFTDSFVENFYYSAVREGDKFYDMLKLSYRVCINFPDKPIVHASTRIFCGILGNFAKNSNFRTCPYGIFCLSAETAEN